MTINPDVPDRHILADGEILSGRYQVQCFLAAGGMAQVYRVKDIELDGMPLAVKVLPAGLGPHAPRLEDLRREATFGMKLSHPNICSVFGLFAHGESPFLLMELLDGQTLAEILANHGNGCLPLDDSLSVLRQVSAALDYVHARRPCVLHGDVKPGNIMVTLGGEAKLLDFSTAGELSASRAHSAARREAGTPGYLAPERLAGGAPTVAADVYALGVTACRCLLGQAPDEAGHLPREASERAEPHVAAALRSAVATDPALRPPGAGAFLRQLEGKQAGGLRPAEVLEEEGPPPTPPTAQSIPVGRLPVARPDDLPAVQRRARGALWLGIAAVLTCWAVAPGVLLGVLAVAWGTEARRMAPGKCPSPHAAGQAMAGIVAGILAALGGLGALAIVSRWLLS